MAKSGLEGWQIRCGYAQILCCAHKSSFPEDDRLARQRRPSKICIDMRPRGCSGLALARRKVVSRHERVEYGLCPSLTLGESFVFPVTSAFVLLASWQWAWQCWVELEFRLLLCFFCFPKFIFYHTAQDGGPIQPFPACPRDPDRILLVFLPPTPHSHPCCGYLLH